MPDPRIEGDEAPVGAPPGIPATPEVVAEAIRGSLAQQQLTAYPNARRNATPTPIPAPGITPTPVTNSNVTNVPVPSMPAAPAPLPPSSIPGLTPQDWSALPRFQRWLTPTPPGINFPASIGPGLPPQPFAPPGSLEQNLKGISMPQGAMAMVLRQRGINPETTVGRMYMAQADELRSVYEMAAGQGAGLQPGQTMPTADGYLSFLQGYIDKMQDQGSAGREDINALRGIVRAQVSEAIRNPNSDIYKSMAAQVARREQSGAGDGPPEMVLWYGLIRPALAATGATPAHIRGAEGNFMRLYQRYQEYSVTAGTELTFQDFLAQAGYDPFR